VLVVRAGDDGEVNAILLKQVPVFHLALPPIEWVTFI